MATIQDYITISKCTTIIELFSIFYEKNALKQSNPQTYLQKFRAFKQILYANMPNTEFIIDYLNQFKSNIETNFPINSAEEGSKLTRNRSSHENQFNFDFNVNSTRHSNQHSYPKIKPFLAIQNISRNRTTMTPNLTIKPQFSLSSTEMNSKIQFLNEMIYSESLNNMLLFPDDTAILKFDFNSKDFLKEKSKLTIIGKDPSNLIKEIRTTEKLLSLHEIRVHPELKKIKSKLEEYKEIIQVTENNDGFYYGCALSWIISLINSKNSSSKSNLTILINIFCLVYSRNINILSSEFNSETARDYFCDSFQDIIKRIQRKEIDIATNFYNDIINSSFFEKCLLSFFKEVFLHNGQDLENYRTSRSNKLYNNEIDINNLENIATLIQMDISILTISPNTLSEKYVICKDLGLNHNTNKVPQILNVLNFEDMNFCTTSNYMFLFKEEKAIKGFSNFDDTVATNGIENSFEIRNFSLILNNGEKGKPKNTNVVGFNVKKDSINHPKSDLNIDSVNSPFISSKTQNKNILQIDLNSNQIRKPYLNQKPIIESVFTPVNRRSNTNIIGFEFNANVFDQIQLKTPNYNTILPKEKQGTPLKHAILRNNFSANKKAARARNNNLEEVVVNNLVVNENIIHNINEDDSNTLSRNNSGSVELTKITHHHSSNKALLNHTRKNVRSGSKMNSKRSSFDDHGTIKTRFSVEESKELGKIPNFLKKRLNETNNLLNFNSSEIQEALKKYLNLEPLTPTSSTLTTSKSNSLMAAYTNIIKANLQKMEVLEYNDLHIPSTPNSQNYPISSSPENHLPYLFETSNTEYIKNFNIYERHSTKHHDDKTKTISFPLPLGISPRPDIGSAYNGSTTNALDILTTSHNTKNDVEFIGTIDSLGINSYMYQHIVPKSTLNTDNFMVDYANNHGNSFNNNNMNEVKHEGYDKILNNFMTCIKCGREFLKADKYDMYSNICYFCR